MGGPLHFFALLILIGALVAGVIAVISSHSPTIQSFNSLTPKPSFVSQPAGGEKPAPSPSSGGSSGAPAINPRDIPQGFTAAQLSPYFKKVRIGSTSRGGFSLSADFSGLDLIDVTGWEVRTNNGSVLVSQAVGDISPYGWVGAGGDILLGSGGHVSVSGAVSPIGINFRLNKCTGYFNNTIAFSPPLPNSCPTVNPDEITSFSGKCQSFLLSMSSCHQPTTKELDSFMGDPNCRSFLDGFTYKGCYIQNHANPRFFSNDWRVWLGSRMPFDPEHDRVLLLDMNKLSVDIQTY